MGLRTSFVGHPPGQKRQISVWTSRIGGLHRFRQWRDLGGLLLGQESDSDLGLWKIRPKGGHQLDRIGGKG
ncbi:unnamed protein product [Sphagnum balticum]